MRTHQKTSRKPLVLGVSLQDILDSLPHYVLMIDEHHNILMANRAVQDQLKADPSQILGGYCPKVIHGSDGPIAECPLPAAVASNSPSETDYYDSASERWYKSVVYPVSTKSRHRVYLHWLQDIDALKRAEERLSTTNDRLRKVEAGIIGVLSRLTEMRDPYTAGHQQRVSALAMAIGRRLGWPEERIEGLGVSGAVHDIGKMAIPAEILNRTAKLSALEYAIVKTHPEMGHSVLNGIEFPWPIATAVLQHHEWMDGSGYPYGIKGSDIIPEARILAVADSFEAMTSHRPYRQGRATEAALHELVSHRGTLYDADIVDACVEVIRAEGTNAWAME